MPDFTDISALALLAAVLLMVERWMGKLLDVLTTHLERMFDNNAAILDVLLTIRESLQSLNKK
jgi:hypothetical protein